MALQGIEKTHKKLKKNKKWLGTEDAECKKQTVNISMFAETRYNYGLPFFSTVEDQSTHLPFGWL